MAKLMLGTTNSRRPAQGGAPVLRGEIASSQGKHDEAIASLRTAAATEDKLTYNEPADWPLPVSNYLGAALLKAEAPGRSGQGVRERPAEIPEERLGPVRPGAGAGRDGRQQAAVETRKQLRRGVAVVGYEAAERGVLTRVGLSTRIRGTRGRCRRSTALEQRELAFGRRLVGFGQFDQRGRGRCFRRRRWVLARAALQAVRRKSSALPARVRARVAALPRRAGSFNAWRGTPSRNAWRSACEVLDQVPRRIQRGVVVQQAHPERGQRAHAIPRAAVGAAHFQVLLEPHFRERGGHVVGPVAQGRQRARQRLELAVHEPAERLARGRSTYSPLRYEKYIGTSSR